MENLSYNYVSCATKNNTDPVVIKISCDSELITRAYEALKYFNGHGSIKVLDINNDCSALLLEQAIPGESLKDNKNLFLSEKINIYTSVVKKISETTTPIDPSFQHVKSWLRAIDDINSNHHKVIPSYLIEKAIEIKNYLLSTTQKEILLHGDLHLDNILKHQDSWLAIDPKGIVGEICFELWLFDFMELNKTENSKINISLIKKTAEELSEKLNIDPLRLIQWNFVRAILSACWFIEDKGEPGKVIAFAKDLYFLINQETFKITIKLLK